MNDIIIAILLIAVAAFLYYYLVYRKKGINKETAAQREIAEIIRKFTREELQKQQKQRNLQKPRKSQTQKQLSRYKENNGSNQKECHPQQLRDNKLNDDDDDNDDNNANEQDLKEASPPAMEPIITTKMRTELTDKEKKQLEELWVMCLSDPEKSSDMGLKDNTRVFMVWNPIGQLIGQAAVLVIDEHDMQGAFSPIKNLGLDASSLILYNVCVHPEARRQGIASIMLTEVHVWAQENNKHKIILFVKPDNEQAQRIYKKLGYTMDGANTAYGKGELQMTLCF